MSKKIDDKTMKERLDTFKEFVDSNGRAVIQKRVTKLSALTGNTLETKELSVEGSNLKQVKEIFQEEWKNG
jgi:hypothetical protein